MAKEVYGIQELKDLASAVGHTATALEGVLADGKVDLSDLFRLPGVVSAAQEFTAVEWPKVIPEVTDLSSDEATELAAHFKTVFNLENDGVEATVETGLDIVFKVVEAVKMIRAIAQDILSKAS